MRTIRVTGHLGMDPEVRTTKSGIQYTTIRIASHEYNDPEDSTSWFSGTVWEPGWQKFCQSLKKGTGVIVEGDYSDRIYTSNKTGQNEISRDIRVNAIYYTLGGRRDDDTQNAQTAPAETPAPAPAAPAKPTKAKKVAEPEPAPASDDDLPF